MKQLDFNTPLLGVDGKPVDKETVGTQFALFLANDQTSKGLQSIKFFSLAEKLYKGDPIEVDEADHKMLTTFVGEHPQMTALIRAQILRFLL